MKKLTLLLSCIAMTSFFSCGILSSCRHEDDEIVEKTINPILGTKWIAENGKYLYFKTENSGIFYEGDSYDKGDPYEDFTYTFDSRDNTIILLSGDEYERAQYTPSYILLGGHKFYKE